MDELELTPQFRVEYFLDEIVNSTDCPYEARDRIEMYLARIAGADIVTPEPQYRIEFYLAKIAGDDVEIPAPQHRAEFYLAALCGEEVELPEPHDRIDYWLYQWAEGGSLPWQTFTGNPLQFNAPKAHTLKSTSVAFSPQQDLHGYSNPWPAGGGANIAAPEVSAASTLALANNNGVFSVTRVGNVTSNPRAYFTKKFEDIGLIEGETYTAYCYDPVQNSYGCGVYNGSGGMAVLDIHESAHTFVYSASTMSTRRLGVWSNSPNDLPLNTTIYFHAVLVKGSSAPSAFLPYENLCPISGWTDLDIYNEPDYDPTAQPMTTLTFGQTVYGGTASVAEDGTGQGRDEWYYFVPNGQTDYRTSGQTDSVAVCQIYFGSNNLPLGIANTAISNRFSSKIASGIPGRMVGLADDIYMVIAKSELSSVDEAGYRAWFEAHETQIAYKRQALTPFSVTASSTPTAVAGINTMWTDGDTLTVEARAEAVNLSALQSLNMLLGGRYYNNGTADEPTDEEALDILLGGNER